MHSYFIQSGGTQRFLEQCVFRQCRPTNPLSGRSNSRWQKFLYPFGQSCPEWRSNFHCPDFVSQSRKPTFLFSMCFQPEPDSIVHQVAMPEVPSPENLMDWTEILEKASKMELPAAMKAMVKFRREEIPSAFYRVFSVKRSYIATAISLVSSCRRGLHFEAGQNGFEAPSRSVQDLCLDQS